MSPMKDSASCMFQDVLLTVNVRVTTIMHSIYKTTTALYARRGMGGVLGHPTVTAAPTRHTGTHTISTNRVQLGCHHSKTSSKARIVAALPLRIMDGTPIHERKHYLQLPKRDPGERGPTACECRPGGPAMLSSRQCTSYKHLTRQTQTLRMASHCRGTRVGIRVKIRAVRRWCRTDCRVTGIKRRGSRWQA